jgi:hypothetical protein
LPFLFYTHQATATTPQIVAPCLKVRCARNRSKHTILFPPTRAQRELFTHYTSFVGNLARSACGPRALPSNVSLGRTTHICDIYVQFDNGADRCQPRSLQGSPSELVPDRAERESPATRWGSVGCWEAARHGEQPLVHARHPSHATHLPPNLLRLILCEGWPMRIKASPRTKNSHSSLACCKASGCPGDGLIPVHLA